VVYRRVLLDGMHQGYSYLKGDNYSEWRKGVALTLACGDVDWVVTTPQPVKPKEPERAITNDDATWEEKMRDCALLEKSYDLNSKRWIAANKKCMVMVKNTIEPVILDSIEECDSVGEYLEKIKSQFY
jgi:hypothetical protein